MGKTIKKKLDPKGYLFPMPAVIVGAKVDDKPNFCTVAYCGIVNMKPPMISIECSNKHYTTEGIINNKEFSINIPNAEIAELTDYIGMNSGRSIDKSELFSVFYGDSEKIPLIEEAPINLACKLVKSVELAGEINLFIGEIVEAFTSEECLIDGKLSIEKIDPLIYSTGDKAYYKVGEKIGAAWKIGNNIKGK